jgi:hypothetical protein
MLAACHRCVSFATRAVLCACTCNDGPCVHTVLPATHMRQAEPVARPPTTTTAPAAPAQVIRLLKPQEDEIAQHYAVKTIENIASQGGQWASKFASTEVVFSLVQVGHGAVHHAADLQSHMTDASWCSREPLLAERTDAEMHPGQLCLCLPLVSNQAGSSAAPVTRPPPCVPAPCCPQIYNTSKSENLKATTASTLSRLLRSSPPLVSFLIDKFGARLITAGLADSSSKVQVGAGTALEAQRAGLCSWPAGAPCQCIAHAWCTALLLTGPLPVLPPPTTTTIMYPDACQPAAWTTSALRVTQPASLLPAAPPAPCRWRLSTCSTWR